MRKFLALISLFGVFGFLNSEEQKRRYFQFEYSLEQTELHNVMLFGSDGWSLVDNKISSNSSRAFLELSLFPNWVSTIAVELFSTDGFVPTQREKHNNFENSLSFLQIFWGVPESSIPQVVFYQAVFRAKGVVEWNRGFYRKNKLMQIGETFNLETKYTTLQLKWIFKEVLIGAGLSNFEILGLEKMATSTETSPDYSVEEVSNYTGAVFSASYCDKASPFTEISWLKFDYGGGGEVAWAKVGVLIKFGMEFGPRIEFWEDCFVKPWLGVYFWQMGAGSDDDDEDSNEQNQAANSDYGYTSGLEFRLAF